MMMPPPTPSMLPNTPASDGDGEDRQQGGHRRRHSASAGRAAQALDGRPPALLREAPLDRRARRPRGLARRRRRLVEPPQLEAQAAQGVHLVQVLAALRPAGDREAGGPVPQPHGAVGDVLVLAAGPAGAERLHVALGEEGVVALGDVDGLGHGGGASAPAKPTTGRDSLRPCSPSPSPSAPPLCWGSGDFLGGLTTRRASLWAVIVGSQAVGPRGRRAGHPRHRPRLARPRRGVAGAAGRRRQRGRHLVVLQGARHRHDEHRGADQRHERPGAVRRRHRRAASGRRRCSWPASPWPRPASCSPPSSRSAPARPSASRRCPASRRWSRPRVRDGRRRRARPGAAGSRRDQRLAIGLALLAALCIGLVLLGYDATAQHDPLWAMLGGRMSSATFFASSSWCCGRACA